MKSSRSISCVGASGMQLMEVMSRPYAYVCAYVCAYACAYVCAYAYAYVCACAYACA